ncbi:MAG: phosphoribosylglycinamide formyltransferase [Sphaerochaetaceae bacterium]|nr:phosphoribosylglycinamide formyltransferase [Sphaerochaetaceae bacterium]
MLKVAVLVSGRGTNLEAILKEKHKGNLEKCEISCVISNNKEAYALEVAKSYDVSAIAICEKKQKDFENKLLKKLNDRDIGLVVLAGFIKILSPSFIISYNKPIINVHPALIPSFCGKGYYGLKVHQAALEKGVKVSGATVHFVNEIPDGGKIILQKAVEVKEGDTPEILQKRIMEEAEWVLLPKAIDLISKENL